MARGTLIEGVPNGSAAAPYAMIAHFQFASAEPLKAALANPAMADVRADVAKFTDLKPTVMLGIDVDQLLLSYSGRANATPAPHG
jgi:uncharacterized protein (TIGR02118 family)